MRGETHWGEQGRFYATVADAYLRAERARVVQQARRRFLAKVEDYIEAAEALANSDAGAADRSDKELDGMRAAVAEILRVQGALEAAVESVPKAEMRGWEDLFQRLAAAREALEDLHDGLSATLSLRDPEPSVPWEDVKRDLGI